MLSEREGNVREGNHSGKADSTPPANFPVASLSGFEVELSEHRESLASPQNAFVPLRNGVRSCPTR